MVERPKSSHLEKRTLRVYRALVVVMSLTCLILLSAITYLAFRLLEGSPFQVAGTVLLSLIAIGFVIFVVLMYYRKFFRRDLAHLQEYTFKMEEYVPHKKHRIR
jgi:O-antigen/teichoic acid export membrane protein